MKARLVTALLVDGCGHAAHHRRGADRLRRPAPRQQPGDVRSGIRHLLLNIIEVDADAEIVVLTRGGRG